MRRSTGTNGRGNMRHGLISLLTVVIVISLATAAVLTVATSHAMAALSQRQANMCAEGYAAERSAQALLAALDEDLETSGKSGQALLSHIDNSLDNLLGNACVEGVSATGDLKNNTLTCTFVTQGGRMLQMSLEIDDDATYDVVSWRLTAAPQEHTTGDMLWNGSTAQE
ncbi:MAG: hypothetical protein IKG21_02360 [Atopobiaceae bacterium]|nr:hypothetical protein [Atopobiaceae bacterium]